MDTACPYFIEDLLLVGGLIRLTVLVLVFLCVVFEVFCVVVVDRLVVHIVKLVCFAEHNANLRIYADAASIRSIRIPFVDSDYIVDNILLFAQQIAIAKASAASSGLIGSFNPSKS